MDIGWKVFWLIVAVLLLSSGAALIGAWLAPQRIEQQDIEPADVFDGYDREETVELRIEIPAPPVVAHRPMSAMERFEGPTRWITIPSPEPERPWWYGGRHSVRETRCRVPLYLAVPQATAEFPQLDWSTYPTAEMDGVR